jgi:uncharacterized protein YkwD
MWRTTVIACAVAVLAAGMPGIATASTKKSASGCAGGDTTPVDDASLALAGDAVVCLVNRERTARGLVALRASNLLRKAAAGHSDDMVANKFFSHAGSTGSSVRQRIARTGYLRGAGAAIVGETLAWGSGPYGTPATMVAMFLASPEHRRTLLTRGFREVGAGLVLGSPEAGISRACTATLDFGRR